MVRLVFAALSSISAGSFSMQQLLCVGIGAPVDVVNTIWFVIYTRPGMAICGWWWNHCSYAWKLGVCRLSVRTTCSPVGMGLGVIVC